MRHCCAGLLVLVAVATMRLWPGPPPEIDPVDMEGKVVVLTGATAGVGRHAAQLLSRSGATVVIGCRNMSKGEALALELPGKTAVLHYDAADLASVRSFAAAVRARFSEVAVLVNNAGVGGGSERRYLATRDGFEEAFQQNYLAPALLTFELLPALRAAAPGARVLWTTSQIHKMGAVDFAVLGDAGKEGNSSRGQRCSMLYPYLFLADHLVPGCRYANSKLLLTTLALRLGRRSGATTPAIASIALHPASSPSDVVDQFTLLPMGRLRQFACAYLGLCYEGRVGLLTAHLASHPELQRGSGRYYHSDSPPFVRCGLPAEECARDEPAALARDPEVQDRLLAETCRLLGKTSTECEELANLATS